MHNPKIIKKVNIIGPEEDAKAMSKFLEENLDDIYEIKILGYNNIAVCSPKTIFILLYDLNNRETYDKLFEYESNVGFLFNSIIVGNNLGDESKRQVATEEVTIYANDKVVYSLEMNVAENVGVAYFLNLIKEIVDDENESSLFGMDMGRSFVTSTGVDTRPSNTNCLIALKLLSFVASATVLTFGILSIAGLVGSSGMCAMTAKLMINACFGSKVAAGVASYSLAAGSTVSTLHFFKKAFVEPCFGTTPASQGYMKTTI